MFETIALILVLAIACPLIDDLWRSKLRSTQSLRLSSADPTEKPRIRLEYGQFWVCETPKYYAACHVTQPNARQRAYRQWRAKHLGLRVPENDLEMTKPSKEHNHHG